MTHSREAFWWSLFSAGGVLAALFVPILIVTTGVWLPASADSVDRYNRLRGALGFWPVRVVLVVVVALAFFHCAHRIRHVLLGFGLRSADTLLAVVCYGGALAGSIAALVGVLRL